MGARFWTDGKQEFPSRPVQPRIVKCPGCVVLFWLDDAERLGEVESFEDTTDQFSEARAYETPNEIDYLSFLQDNKLTPEDEQYIRKMAWWSANDRFRYEKHGETAGSHFSQEQERNLAALYESLDPEEPNDRLMKVELARERCMFDEAVSLLQFSFPEDFATAVDFIQELCIARRSTVAEI